MEIRSIFYVKQNMYTGDKTSSFCEMANWNYTTKQELYIELEYSVTTFYSIGWIFTWSLVIVVRSHVNNTKNIIKYEKLRVLRESGFLLCTCLTIKRSRVIFCYCQEEIRRT